MTKIEAHRKYEELKENAAAIRKALVLCKSNFFTECKEREIYRLLKEAQQIKEAYEL